MADDHKAHQRTDFEVFIRQHSVDMGVSLSLDRSNTQPHNYADIMVNSMWWGWQAGQTALLLRISAEDL